MNKYRIVTEVFVAEDETEDWEKAASIGHVVEAESFRKALPQFNKHLNDQWGRVANMAHVIDGEEPPDAEAKDGGP